MPYTIRIDDSGIDTRYYCVHKENPDGSIGELVPGGCHGTREEAEAHLAALHANVDNEARERDTTSDAEVSMEVAMLYASLPDAQFFAEYDNGHKALLEADELPGRMARRILFKNLAVAKAERNANGDEISIENLDELARTIASMPMSDIHPGRGKSPAIVGVMEGGSRVSVQSGTEGVTESYLLVDGFFWAGRNSNVVRETIGGQRRPSIEAYSEFDGCSVCGEWFGSSDQYCEHLLPAMNGRRLPQGVSRMHRGLYALGAANVHNPAASGVGFQDPHFYLSADAREQEIYMNEETNKVVADTPAPPPAGEPREDSTNTFEAERSRLEGLLEASRKRFDILKERVIAMLEAGLTAESVKTLVADEAILDVPAAAFVLMCENLKPTQAGNQPNPSLLADEAPADGAVVSWDTIYGG